MRRAPDPQQRRRDLCDAAISLLAEDGIKGLSHVKVDKRAGVPDGTTSFNYRTRAALVSAVAQRIADLDWNELARATEARPPSSKEPAPSRLAKLIIRSTSGKSLERTKARYELAMQANRDEALAAALHHNTERFNELIRAAVYHFAQRNGDDDAGLLDRQTFVLRTFINGVMFGFVSGDRTIRSAAQLDEMMTDVIAGVQKPTP